MSRYITDEEEADRKLLLGALWRCHSASEEPCPGGDNCEANLILNTYLTADERAALETRFRAATDDWSIQKREWRDVARRLADVARRTCGPWHGIGRDACERCSDEAAALAAFDELNK